MSQEKEIKIEDGNAKEQVENEQVSKTWSVEFYIIIYAELKRGGMIRK